MKRENRIIASLIGHRTAYDALSNVLDEADFTRLGWRIIEEIEQYYTTDKEAEHVDIPTIKDIIGVKYPKHNPQFFLILDDLEEVSSPNIVKEYLALKSDGIKALLAEALIGKAGNEVVDELIDKLRLVHNTEEGGDDESIIIDRDIEDILNAVKPENLLPVVPNELNENLGGGVIRGSQMCIYAPVECGKTLMSVALTCAWLRHGEVVVYLGNEENADSILERVYNNLTGMNRAQMLTSPMRAKQRAADNGIKNLVFLNKAPGTVMDIRRAVDKYKATAIIVDQAANLEHGKLSKTEKAEAVSASLREIGKEYNTTNVIIHQADAEAIGKLVLESSNLYFSNVGVQGAMDIMIGMGMNEEWSQQNRRMLSITKNKNNGYHGYFPININPELSRIVE